jgi:hypothetical protein
MANGTLIDGNSELLAGPLGNSYVAFNGWLLGKTTEDIAFNKDEDVKDIMYSQDGTKPSDHVSTGHLMNVSATFGEIKTSLLKQILYSFNSQATAATDDSGTFGRNIYTSLRNTKAKPLRIYATDSDGNILTNDQDIINCYEALPLIDENIINWGADTQRNLPVTFQIYFNEFGTNQVVGGPSGAFAYYGDPAQEKVPALVWPDVAEPVLVSATATSATNLDIVFDKNIAFQGGSYSVGIIANVDGTFVDPTSGSITTTTASMTFAAATFTAGDVIEVSISSVVIEDTETTPNTYSGVDGQPVTNSVP